MSLSRLFAFQRAVVENDTEAISATAEEKMEGLNLEDFGFFKLDNPD